MIKIRIQLKVDATTTTDIPQSFPQARAKGIPGTTYLVWVATVTSSNAFGTTQLVQLLTLADPAVMVGTSHSVVDAGLPMCQLYFFHNKGTLSLAGFAVDSSKLFVKFIEKKQMQISSTKQVVSSTKTSPNFMENKRELE